MATNISSLDVILAKLGSITNLSDEKRQAIERLPFKTQLFKAGQDIAREGDKPVNCCFVIDGWAFRYKILAEGKRQIFSFHVRGDIPDLQSLHLPVMDHAIGALTQTTLGFIPHQAVRGLAAEYPNIAAALWRDTLIDAAIFREWMIGMGRRSAVGNLAHLLCELYHKQEAVGLASDYLCALPLNQLELADALGLSNVHVNRVLQTLRIDGLLTWKRGVLKIKKWDQLAQMANFDPTYLHLEQGTAE